MLKAKNAENKRKTMMLAKKYIFSKQTETKSPLFIKNT